MNGPLLIDTDIWVEGERQPAVIANWLADQGDVATCDTVRAEFLVGVHAPRQPATRGRHGQRVRGPGRRAEQRGVPGGPIGSCHSDRRCRTASPSTAKATSMCR